MSFARCTAPLLFLMVAVDTMGNRAAAQGIGAPIRLDRQRVIELSSAQAPDILLARARANETRALRIGAGAYAPTNPELAVSAGPHFYPDNTLTPDWAISLQWPIDVSRARSARITAVEESVRAADGEALAAARTVIAEALDLLVRTLGANERVRIEMQRVGLDESLLQVAQARRRAGTTGDAEVALALVLRADSQARLRTAEAERDAALVMLRTRIGLDAAAQIELIEAGLDDEPPPLEQLLGRLAGRADLMVAAARRKAAQADVTLQRRLGIPVPRIFATGGRSNEYYFEAGVQMPLPVYQSNQTNRAVAVARTETSRVEEQSVRARAEGEIRTAYLLYRGAQAAYLTLRDALPAITDADHLATRSFELGQSTLTSLLGARREVLSARVALVEAQITIRRTRLGVDAAAGRLP